MGLHGASGGFETLGHKGNIGKRSEKGDVELDEPLAALGVEPGLLGEPGARYAA